MRARPAPALYKRRSPAYEMPAEEGLRVDTGVQPFLRCRPFYSIRRMIAKLIATGPIAPPRACSPDLRRSKSVTVAGREDQCQHFRTAC